MIRRFAIVAGALAAVWLVAGQAQAQGFGSGPGRINRPSVSPYMNLVTGDALSQVGLGGAYYQTLVKPFTDGRRAINANSSAISRLQYQAAYGGAYGQAGGGGGGNGQFMNYSHYYPGASGR